MKTDLLTSLTWSMGAVAATLLFWSIIAFLLRLLQKSRRTGNPAAEPYLDPSLRDHIDQTDISVKSAWGFIIATILIFSAFYGLAAFFNQMEVITAAGLSICGIALSAVAFLKWRRAVNIQQEVRWQSEAKSIVSEAVEQMVKRGYTVFNNVVVQGGVIDHLLIGPKGVFAVHSLVRRITLKTDPPSGAQATYDGRTIYFPHGKDHLSIEEAVTRTDWISEWLSAKLPEPLAARAIIALPGWQVKRTSAEGISVINPNQMEALFQYIRPRPLAKETIHYIADQVKAYCGQNLAAQPMAPLFETPR